MTTVRRAGGSRWFWASAGLHALLFSGLGALALRRPAPPLEIATFELVGAPSTGEGGGVPEPEEHPAPASAPEAPQDPQETVPDARAAIAPEAVRPATRPSASPAPSTPSTSRPQGGGDGAPGAPGGDTLSVGGGGGPPSVMALWLSRVKFLVERNWRAPAGLQGVAAAPEVVFSVARDGRAGRPALRVRSGNPTLDRLALRAIEAVDAFPPLPEAWPASKVDLRYVLQYAP